MQKQEKGIYIEVFEDKVKLLPKQNIYIAGTKVLKRVFTGIELPEGFLVPSESVILVIKSFCINNSLLYTGQLVKIMKVGRVIQDNEFTAHFKGKYPELIPKETLYDRIIRKYPLPALSEGFYIKKNIWFFLVRQILKKKQVLLTGASGTGKTELVYFITKYLQKKGAKNIVGVPEVFDMAVQNPEASFKGQVHVENGTSFFRYSRFAQKIQEKNRCILLDEFNRGDVATQNMLMPVLDKRRTLYVERAKESEIKVHKGTFFWATANIGYSFSGTSQIDEAVSQRFQIIHIDYPPKSAEVKILQVRVGILRKEAVEIVDFANAIRESDIFQKKPSLRMLLETAELVKDGFDIIPAFRYSIQNQILNPNDIDMLTSFNNLI